MADWGSIHKATTDGKTPGSGEEGTVIQPGINAPAHGPRHEVNYSATDERGGHARDLSGWKSVDHMSGPVTESDWESSTGHFPDGPGVWRQT
jgi:hypothetical protein